MNLKKISTNILLIFFIFLVDRVSKIYIIKISEIESALSNAQVIDVNEIPETGRVVFGSTVRIYDIDNDKEVTYKRSLSDNGFLLLDNLNHQAGPIVYWDLLHQIQKNQPHHLKVV